MNPSSQNEHLHELFVEGRRWWRQGQRVRDDMARACELLNVGSFGGLILTSNEITYVVNTMYGAGGRYPRSELRRLFDAGLYEEPKSHKNKVNGMISPKPTQKFIDEMNILKAYLSI